MRLIDADKLRIKCHTVNDLQPDKFVVSRMVVSSEAIDTEPTVKAIPIEWIENWLKTCIPRYDYDRMTYMADVDEMLEDWEEENEID